METRSFIGRNIKKLIPEIFEKINEFLSVLFEAITVIYPDDWYWMYHFPKNDGFCFTDWIKFKEPDFKRVFERLWKEKKRSDAKWKNWTAHR